MAGKTRWAPQRQPQAWYQSKLFKEVNYSSSAPPFFAERLSTEDRLYGHRHGLPLVVGLNIKPESRFGRFAGGKSPRMGREGLAVGLDWLCILRVDT